MKQDLKIINMYTGELTGFPKEVVEKMIERQYEQTGKRDVTVFERNRCAHAIKGGFFWHNTIEEKAEPRWWTDVVFHRRFPKFFERYPKQSNQNTMLDLKQKLQDLIALVPEKEAQLKAILKDELNPIDLYNETGIGDRKVYVKDGCSHNSLISVWVEDNGELYLSNCFDWELTNRSGYFTLKPQHKK